MRNTILFLISFLVVVSSCLAEDVKFQFNINGAHCKHLHITDINGKLIAITTEAVIMSPIEDSDTEIIKALKKYIQDNNITLVNFKRIKTTINLAGVTIG